MKNAKTEKALSSLEWAIAQSVGEPRHPDEFTCDEFMKAGGGTSRDSAASRLTKLVNEGRLTKRLFSVNGSNCALYRKV